MSCISHVNLCPSSGDVEVVLLQKILQSLNESGGIGGVTSLNVNGSGPQTGAVSITIPGALLNFQDQNAGGDGVVYSDSGTNEVFRTMAGSEHVQFAGAAPRIHTTSALTDQITLLATNSKANGSFFEAYGTGHVNAGGAQISIHDGGEFRVRSAPVASTTSFIALALNGTNRSLDIAGNGVVNTPALTLAGDLSTGWYRNAANQWTFASSTIPLFRIVTGFFTFASTMAFAWTSGDALAAGDLYLTREAASILALGGSAFSSGNNVLRVYESTDGVPTNFRRLNILTQAGNHRIFTEAAGTGLTAGQPRILQVGTGPSVGTDIAGQSVLWHSGQGTGTGTGGSHLFQVSAPGATSAVVNALATRLTLDTTDLTMATAVRLAVASGANQRAGNATLVAGTVTVANTTVTANSIVLYSRKTSGGTIGTAMTYTVSAATSFTLTSDSALDTSTFSYFIIEVP